MLDNIRRNSQSVLQLLQSKHIVVLCGGPFSESEVSLASAATVVGILEEMDLNVVKYEITSVDQLLGFLTSLPKNTVIFNALHGTFGEDGSLAAILSALQIPYTHSPVAPSALAMNKYLTKKLAAACNIRVAKGVLFKPTELPTVDHIGYPLILKPNNDGSSVGLFLINNYQELTDAIKECEGKYHYMLIEEYLPGAEYSVGLVDGKALAVTNIVPINNILYNYSAKYDNQGSQHIVPAQINDNLKDYMLSSAEKLYREIGCKGIARVDFKAKEGEIYFLELNTHPGFTRTSLLPEQAVYCNISFKELCLFLLANALHESE